MPERMNLTKAVIDGLPLPEAGKRTYYSDARAPGLQVCVTWTGKRTWYFSRWAAGRSQRVRIGEYPGVTLELARKEAAKYSAMVAQGEDPSLPAKRKREELTFGELHTWYMDTYSKPRKRSWKADQWSFDNHLAHLARYPLRRITRTLVRETHAAIAAKKEQKKGGPYQANRVLAMISVMFTRAIADELFDGANPTTGIKPFPEQSRDRRLTAAEVPRLLEAIQVEPNLTVRDAVMMLLFTGQRKGEVLSMRWDQVDLDERTWRIPMTKNGRPQIVPLEDAELQILREREKKREGCEWVFPGRADSETGHIKNVDDGWKRILTRAKIENLRLHDLRRTLGSWAVDTGASLPVVGKMLNHQSQATTAVYARLSLDPVREAKARAHEAIMKSKAT